MKMLPGSGPYIIKDEDIINQESFSLTRLDNWWAKDHKTSKNMYNFDRITISVVKDNEALIKDNHLHSDISDKSDEKVRNVIFARNADTKFLSTNVIVLSFSSS